MSIPENFKKLTGEWRGVNRLHTVWIEETPLQESKSDASVQTAANEKFLKIEYDWSYENETQDGLLLVGSEENSVETTAFWIDSWHMRDKFLSSDGKYDGDSITVKGFYEVPNHPDWGWRTDIFFTDENSFKFVMYNVSPEGEESLAVEAIYERK
jgi:hypothetical protein